MKFAVVALIATVAAADTPVPKTDDTWKWDVCLKAGDCGKTWVCCNATKAKDGSSTSSGTMICTDPAGSGSVPSTATTKYAGFEYFCTHTQHKAAIDYAAKMDGSSSLAVSACAAAASVFLLA